MQTTSKGRNVFIGKRTPQHDVDAVHEADIHDGRQECQALSCKDSIVDNRLFLTFLIIQKVCIQIGTFLNIKKKNSKSPHTAQKLFTEIANFRDKRIHHLTFACISLCLTGIW